MKRQSITMDTFADTRNVSAILKALGFKTWYRASEDLKFILFFEEKEKPIKLIDIY